MSAALYHLIHLMSWGVIVLSVALFVALAALQTGLLDGVTSNFAQRALHHLSRQANGADQLGTAGSRLGFEKNIDVKRTVLRLTLGGSLAIEGQDISFQTVAYNDNQSTANDDPAVKLSAKIVRLNVDLMALIFDRPRIKAIDVSDVEISVLSSNERAIDNAKNQQAQHRRIDQLSALPDQLFAILDRLSGQSLTQNLSNVSIENVVVTQQGALTDRALMIEKASLLFDQNQFHGFQADLAFQDQPFSVSGDLDASDEDVFSIHIHQLPVSFESQHPDPKLRSGLDTQLSAHFTIARGLAGQNPQFDMAAKLAAGQLKLGGENVPLGESEFFVSYNFDKKSIELSSSVFNVADSVFPLKGGIIDGDNYGDAPQQSYVYDLVVDQGQLAPIDTNEMPIIMSAKAFGFFEPLEKRLEAKELLIVAEDQYVVGNSVMIFEKGTSPEINLAVKVPQIRTNIAKQLWPFWLGRGARSWAIENIFGGVVKDVNFWLHIDKGRLANPQRPIRHTADDYRVDYQFENARVNLVGDVPPVRGASGRIEVRGEALTVHIDEGTSYFPSNRKMELNEGSRFVVPNTNNVPLMAEVDLNMSGQGDAAAELISFKPIDALDAIGIVPEDISGLVQGNVKARFGLIQSQSPPEPEWTAVLDLSGVDLKKPVEDRILTDITGTLDVDPKRAILTAKMKMDDIDVEANVTEPIGASDFAARLDLSGTLTARDRAQLGLGLDDIVLGNAQFELERVGDNREKVTVDLTRSEIVAPGTGWTKAQNVAARAQFIVRRDDTLFFIDDFEFFGDGFSAKGAMVVDQSGLRSAQFSQVKLAPQDDYRLEAKRDGNVLHIDLQGRSLDMRPLIGLIKDSDAEERIVKRNALGYELQAKLASVTGFGGEAFRNVDITYSERRNLANLIKFTGRTSNNGSIAMQLDGDDKGETINIVSDDSGSLWRFFDIYAFVQGGALDLAVTQNGNGPQTGQAIMRDFLVIGDERLNTLVSTRANERERSLNDALKGQLDVSRVAFDQAIIDFELGGGRLDIIDGIVRGPQIGASFNGMLYDDQDNTNMSGTFMPAYALNRVFGDIPVLGALLGNGNDRALLGITFRVSGNADDPRIQVNPLSAIAPGIFRNIFEFQ